jgi:hypothetical protein
MSEGVSPVQIQDIKPHLFDKKNIDQFPTGIGPVQSQVKTAKREGR